MSDRHRDASSTSSWSCGASSSLTTSFRRTRGCCEQIRINDYTVVLNQPFVGDRISRLGLYTFHNNVVWFDEVGADQDMCGPVC